MKFLDEWVDGLLIIRDFALQRRQDISPNESQLEKCK